jgi:hypothetical protein
LTPDGVFELDEDGLLRVPPPPGGEDVEAILRRVIRRTAKVLADYEEDPRTRRWPHSRPPRWTGGSGVRTRSATFAAAPSSRVSLHAGVRVHENDREGRERLARYLLRPPFALQRLSQGEDGRLASRSALGNRHQRVA